MTGRQHQIRVHLHYKNHTILGDPLYGLSKEQIENILDEKLSPKERLKLTGALRLCLHSYHLKFQYKKNKFLISIQKSYGRNQKRYKK